MRFNNETEAITYVFESIARTDWRGRGLDEDTRDITPTKYLLAAAGLLEKRREYVVVTGSKGKGSVAAITARLLESLGHTAGLLTSPHLTTYRQRFRVNGHMIAEADLIRLIEELTPLIDRVNAGLHDNQYLSPQGIFLAVALKWFDEQNVTAAVIEVGRGGRFDDNALVPNMLSLFTPILLEHTRYLGPTLGRIAWHKAGIIKPNSYAFSLPQTPEVMAVLRAEAETRGADFEWLAPADTARLIEPTENGQRIEMGRYGVVDMPMLGRYEIANASLAVWAAGNVHARLVMPDRSSGIHHASPEYVARIRAGLENVFWPGRCQKMSDTPAVYIDGATNAQSAQSFIDSIRDRLSEPVISILAIPQDRQYPGVYERLAPLSRKMILTESARNIAIDFPPAEEALAVARQFHDDVIHLPTVAQALDRAIAEAGESGTVVVSAAQPAIGDIMAYYGHEYERI